MGSFNPSDTCQVLLVDPDGVPYDIAGLIGMGTFNPSDTARVVLVDADGNPYKATGGGGGGITIQVEGVDTADQTLANFVAGANVTITNPSGGIIQIDATGGGGSGTVTQVDTTAPITGGPITTTGTIGITQAGAAADGYLSSTDWNTFNSKVGGPTGSDWQIQYNDSGAFAADAFFKWDKSSSPTVFVADNALLDFEWTNYDATVASTHSYFYTEMVTAPTSTGHNINTFYSVDKSSDGVSAATQATGLSSTMAVGPAGEASVGTRVALGGFAVIEGVGNGANEYAALQTITLGNIGTGYTQGSGPVGRLWGIDTSVHGSVAVQPNSLNGIVQTIGNYYNGSPSDNPSAGEWIVTKPFMSAQRSGVTTYPINVGLGIVGYSGDDISDAIGFTTALQIGGTGSPMGEAQSIVGTGIDIRDYTTRGIYIHNPSGTPTADIEITGKGIFPDARITKIGQLTSNGFVKTGSGDGTLSVDTNTYLTSATGVTSVAKNGSTQLHGDVTLTGGTNVTLTQSGNDISIAASGGGGSTSFNAPGLRLTTESGVPVSTSNRTAQGTLYWTPYLSGSVTYWDGAAWQQEYITEQSLALTLTSGKNYDVFYLHGTGLVLSSAWTNDTTRADALGAQNGVTVLSSDHTKLWIGTIRASGSNVIADSGGGVTTQVGGQRFVWNAFNQVPRPLSVFDSTSFWSYGTASWRQANNTAGNKVEYVTGFVGTAVSASVIGGAFATSTSNEASVGVGVDSTSTASGIIGTLKTSTSQIDVTITSDFRGYPGLGYHFLSWNEYGSGGTFGFLGANNGAKSGLDATIMM